MMTLDFSRRRLDAFSRRNLLRQRGEIFFRLGEERLALRQQLLGVDAQKMFLLEQQVVVLGPDGVNAAAPRQQVALEEILILPRRRLRTLHGAVEAIGVFGRFLDARDAP